MSLSVANLVSAEITRFLRELDEDGVASDSSTEELAVRMFLREPVDRRCACGAELVRWEALNGRCNGCRLGLLDAERSGEASALDSLAAQAGVPPRYRSCRLTTFDGVDRVPEVTDWVARPVGNLVLCGDHGVGKTHLATGCLISILAGMRRSGYWCSAPALPDALELEFRGGRERPLWDRLTTVGVLVLDDLGAEKAPENRASRLSLLLDERYQANLPTIVTSNVDLALIAKADSRLAERLLSGATRLVLRGRSRR